MKGLDTMDIGRFDGALEFCTVDPNGSQESFVSCQFVFSREIGVPVFGRHAQDKLSRLASLLQHVALTVTSLLTPTPDI